MLPEIHRMIEREIEHVRNGGKGYIILKMNSLEDKVMISELYRASEAGVKIDLIIRGICCLVPNQPFSKISLLPVLLMLTLNMPGYGISLTKGMIISF